MANEVLPSGDLAVQPTATGAGALPVRSEAVQAYLARMADYAAAQRAKGYLVEQTPIYGPDGVDPYQALADNGMPVEQLFRLGQQFNTNKGNPARTKANQSGVVWTDPNLPDAQYRLINQKGKDQVLYSGTGPDAISQIHDLAVGLSDKGGKKAHWKVEMLNPTTGAWTQQADDDPAKNILGKLASIALPIAGSFLIPGLGLVGGALGAGLGAAGGSAAAGILRGQSIGKILGNAALSGGLSFAGGSLLGGTGALGNGAASGLSSTAGAAGGAASGAVGSAAGNLAGGLVDDIVVMGSRGLGSALGGLGAGIGAGVGGLVNGVGSLASGGVPNNYGGPPETTGSDIVVNAPQTGGNWWENTLPIAGAGGLAVGGLSGLGGAGNEAAKTAVENAQKNGMSASDIANYLKLGSLGVGLLGSLFGGGGAASGGTMPGGLNGGLNPIFTKQLPNPSMPQRTARTMPAQDWTKYGMRPGQSFFSDVPQTYLPPLPGVRDEDWDKYAVGGAVEGHGGGRTDSIPALVSDGEYVVDAETVALLGNGSSKAGAKALDDLRVMVRKHKGKSLAKGELSVDAKRPEQYLKRGK